MDRLRRSGWCALGFSAAILALNVVENIGTGRPDPGSSTEEVARWATEADPYLWATTILVPVAWVLLGIFAAALWSEANKGGHDLFHPVLGLLGTAMTMGTLSAAVATDAALIASEATLDLALMGFLTKLSTALFLFNWAALALALYGLSRTTAALGLLPRWLDRATLTGAALLLLGSTQSAPALNGNLPTLLPGLVGFAIWLLFLLVVGLRLVTSNATRVNTPDPTTRTALTS